MLMGRTARDIGKWGAPVQYALGLIFNITNNETEYEALITGLCLAREVNAASLRVKCNSQLEVNQFKGEYQTKGKYEKILG